MTEAFLIGVNTKRAGSGAPDRRLFVVLDDSPEKALIAVRKLMSPASEVELTGIPVLPETALKLGLMPGQPKQL
jgi:hypothetical protein